ncbi:hypothetical protein O1611_g10595 [Lasiodiplodia mahajangana]|uniref:Uncharacterized protein n=1 Tax=Lasiodiplodia mahajangana TaxID=1108764 RepID=A0ACC2IWG4_9PEZI|nr:hypothetical protein O1611_g10595 [Lasiodiplodia mahajangana]
MLISFFLILPRGPLREATKARGYQPGYQPLREDDEPGPSSVDDIPTVNAASGLLAPGAAVASSALSDAGEDSLSKMGANLRRAKSLFFPYMLPLFLVYLAEYVINQGVSPTCRKPRAANAPFAAKFHPKCLRRIHHRVLGGPVPLSEREFSLGATSVSDSAGICIAGFVSMAMEVWLCNYQVQHGRDWCKKIKVG